MLMRLSACIDGDRILLVKESVAAPLPALVTLRANVVPPVVLNVAVTAAEPTPSSRAATDEAWHSRVQWSMLLVPRTVRANLAYPYASSIVSRPPGSTPTGLTSAT